MTLLCIRNLRVTIGNRRILDGFNLTIGEGERVALVGVSGCGKTLLARCVIGLPPRSARVDGTIRWRGRMLFALDRRAFQGVRGRRIAYMVQHPHSALDPVRRVGDEAVETLRVHRPELGHREARKWIMDWLSRLGFRDPERVFRSYPFQLSGGMAARVYLAMCLAPDPDLLVADEPTAGLDARMARRIFTEMRAHLENRALLLITHDVRVVRGLAERVVVLGAGAVREWGMAGSVLDTPLHPFTRWLTGADGDERVSGDVPVAAGEENSLCPYRFTCRIRQPVCDEQAVPEVPVPEGMVRCHRYCG